VTYLYDGPPVLFGATNEIVEISVPDIFDIHDVDVTVHIDHTWAGDVQLVLESPQGTLVTLMSGQGGGGDHIHNTEFNDDAPSSIISGSPPFTGSYRPLELLSGFNGESGTGVWTLHLVDNFPGLDDGILNWWSLTLGDQLGGAVRGHVAALADGAPMEGVLIELLPTIYSTLTDEHGNYLLMGPEGVYDLYISYPDWCDTLVSHFEIADFDTTDVDIELGKPEAEINISSLNVLSFVDSIDRSTFVITNAGNCELDWSLTTFDEWVHVEVTAGIVPPEDSLEFEIELDATGLSLGDYQSRIEIFHNAAGSPFIIPVFMTVADLPSDAETLPATPDEFALLGNYPNPFNASTMLDYSIPETAQVRIDLYSIDGRLVSRLLDRPVEPGRHRLRIEAGQLASGVYLAAMTAGDFRGTHKIMLLK
jgi:subtilisin-like proprotein convertase family protein